MEANIKGAQWNLNPLTKGKSFEEKRKEWGEATEKFISKWKKRDDYLENPGILEEALNEYEEWKRFYGAETDELYFYWLKMQQNQNDSKLKAKFNDVENFSKKIENDMNFFALKIAKIPKEKQKSFLQNLSLKKYRHFLEKLFAESEYLLSEKEEKIINLKSSSAYSAWIKMLSGFLSKEERQILNSKKEKSMKNFSEILSLIDNKDKEVRDKAAEAFNDVLDKYKEIAENELNAILANKKVDDELRGIKRPDFTRHLNDDLNSDIVDTLIETVSKKFDISRRYYKLKARLLGVDKLEYHERNVEYGKMDKKYSYEDSVQLVNEVLLKLNPKFSGILKRFIDNSQIDFFPRAGKKQGAFCVYFLPTQPTYVMLNHTDKLKDVLTMAHEMGHAINNELIKEKQNSLNFGTPLSTAEVASTFMEDFVLQKLMDDADEETKLYLIMEKLGGDVSSIMRQVACYKFEQELHKEFRKKGYLSYREIGELFKKHMEAYMGEFVKQSPGSENWWVYWGHIRTFFYNYSYASGLLISKFMQKTVKKNPEFIQKVEEFLSAGLSDSPESIFKKMGIDISDKDFWNKGLDEIENLLIEAEKLADKILPQTNNPNPKL